MKSRISILLLSILFSSLAFAGGERESARASGEMCDESAVYQTAVDEGVAETNRAIPFENCGEGAMIGISVSSSGASESGWLILSSATPFTGSSLAPGDTGFITVSINSKFLANGQYLDHLNVSYLLSNGTTETKQIKVHLTVRSVYEEPAGLCFVFDKASLSFSTEENLLPPSQLINFTNCSYDLPELELTVDDNWLDLSETIIAFGNNKQIAVTIRDLLAPGTYHTTINILDRNADAELVGQIPVSLTVQSGMVSPTDIFFNRDEFVIDMTEGETGLLDFFFFQYTGGDNGPVTITSSGGSISGSAFVGLPGPFTLDEPGDSVGSNFNYFLTETLPVGTHHATITNTGTLASGASIPVGSFFFTFNVSPQSSTGQLCVGDTTIRRHLLPLQDFVSVDIGNCGAGGLSFTTQVTQGSSWLSTHPGPFVVGNTKKIFLNINPSYGWNYGEVLLTPSAGDPITLNIELYRSSGSPHVCLTASNFASPITIYEGESISPRTFTIENCGSANSILYPSTSDSANWMDASDQIDWLAFGETGTGTVSFDGVETLLPGTYTDSVFVSGSSFNVTVIVQAGAPLPDYNLCTGVSTINTSILPWQNTQTVYFRIINCGNNTLNYTISSGSFATTTPSSGSVAFEGEQWVQVDLQNLASLSPGTTLPIPITINSEAGTHTVTVNVMVMDI